MSNTDLTTPTVTAIVPAYNRAATIQRAIESILFQTSPVREILVVDDASSDDTTTVVEEMQTRYPQIRLVRHTNNRGGSAARNTGIRESAGDIIAFLDSDDIWELRKLESQLKLMTQRPELGAVYCGTVFVDSSNERKLRTRRTRKVSNFHLLLSSYNVVGSTSGVIVKKELLLEIGGFDERLPSCQDWDLWIRLSRQAPFSFVAEPLLRMSVGTPNRISNNATNVIEGHRIVFDKVHRQAWSTWERRYIRAQHFLTYAELFARYNRPALSFANLCRSFVCLPTRRAAGRLPTIISSLFFRRRSEAF